MPFLLLDLFVLMGQVTRISDIIKILKIKKNCFNGKSDESLTAPISSIHLTSFLAHEDANKKM